jgi:nucleotide-binding universal stress UspA family protein
MPPTERPSPRQQTPVSSSAARTERILVPLDGSHLAEAAIPIASRLAQACGAAITLLHVIEKAAPSSIHGEPHLAEGVEAEAYLERLARRLVAEGRSVDYHVHEVPVGDVARSIAGHADEQESDIVVMCTHGAGDLRRGLWGSNAQRVLQLCRRPVLLVRTERTPPVESPFEPGTIMVPLDGTAAAEAALPLAANLARALEAQLRLVMVVPTLETVAGAHQPRATFLPGTTRMLLDVAEEQATAYLDGLAASLREAGVPSVAEVRRGAPVVELAADAAEHADGLVVAATHGRAGLQAIWSTSVATRLLKRTAAPILLVPIIEPASTSEARSALGESAAVDGEHSRPDPATQGGTHEA